MNSPHSIVLGITGGNACGKKETGRILSSEGFKVLDSDFLAHGLMGITWELTRMARMFWPDWYMGSGSR